MTEHVIIGLFMVLNLYYVNAQEIPQDILSHPNWKLLDRGEDCGHSSSNRIIGGENATLGQYPWIARLGYMVYPDMNNVSVDMYGCGGTVVSERYVLTAAHCHPKRLPGIPSEYDLELINTYLRRPNSRDKAVLSARVRVRLGEHDVTKDEDCQDGVCAPGTQDIDVEEYRCHRGFTDKVRQHDICLVRLVEPIQFNKYVSPICLPTYEKLQKETFGGKLLEVAGWGTEDIETEKQSDILQTLKVPVVQMQFCKLAYYNKAKLTDQQLCAGAVVGKDSCGGDSGGPLMTPLALDAPPRYFLVGVVSYGPEKCAVFSVPGVYTRVSAYLPWILDNIKE